MTVPLSRRRFPRRGLAACLAVLIGVGLLALPARAQTITPKDAVERLFIGPALELGCVLQRLAPGTPVTVETLAALMIQQSENTATDASLRRLGLAAREAEAKRTADGRPVCTVLTANGGQPQPDDRLARLFSTLFRSVEKSL
ncbi:serine hydrolase [Azospirillum tabaci]|uniref:serine hydrolase n=1 Tax=Azospirillum tabaci TaxID=2752310 RepID=UPI0016606259|nr:serine hydrolase [Azospirillum tabaci]